MRPPIPKSILLALCLTLAWPGRDAAARSTGHPDDLNVVIRWNEALLQAVRETRLPPPQVARALAVVHTAMYDAWAAYDQRAVGTRLGAQLRRPPYEHDDGNKREAISHAAYRAAIDLFPAQRATLFDPLMLELGYLTGLLAIAPTAPAAIGRAAAEAVIVFRHHDGANQLGNMTPSGVPYADYTGYQPTNDPFVLTDPNRWQPLLQANGEPQRFLAPHWRHVTPFALASPSQFRPPAPPEFGTAQYLAEAVGVVYRSATLTDYTKAIAIYWADGPSTETPPGHWMLFAQAISARDRHSLDDAVKLFFALSNAVLDASIAAWDCKVAFDYVRPVSAIRNLFAGRTIPSWAGPGRGTGPIDGTAWQSYIPTPPFAEYVSGHSTFSAASAAVLSEFTVSDRMRLRATVRAGSSPVEPGTVPATDITLRWSTFSEAADQAGLSRRLGGIHFRSGDLAGREMGHRIGKQAWAQATRYFNGMKKSRRPATDD